MKVRVWLTQNQTMVAYFVLALATLVLYGGSVHYPFLFDDHEFILKHRFVQHFNLAYQAWASHPPDWQLVEHHARIAWENIFNTFPNRDLTLISFAFNVSLESEGGTFGFHLVNILLHWINGFLLYLLLCRLSVRCPWCISLLVSLLFILHPLHTGSVTYILQRNGLLATTFFLAAFIQWIDLLRSVDKRTRYWKLVTCLVFLLLALISKEMSFTFLPLAWITLWVWVRHHPTHRHHWRLATLAVIPLIGLGAYLATVSLGYWGLYTDSVGFTSSALLSPHHHFLTMNRVLIHYWRLLLFPLAGSYNLDWDFPATTNLADDSAWLSLAVHGVLILTAFWLVKKNFKLAGLGLLWFYITLAPYMVVPEKDWFVEYKTYLPSIGFFLIVAHVLSVLWRRIQNTDLGIGWLAGLQTVSVARTTVVALVLAGVLALGYSGWQRNRVYASRVGVWEDTVVKSPNKSRAMHNLAVSLHQLGRYEEAIQAFYSTLRLNPTHTLVIKNLAASLEQQKQYALAARWFVKLLQLDPGNYKAYMGLGNIAIHSKHYEHAIRSYQQALNINPIAYQAHKGLGLAFQKTGQTQRALYHYHQFLRQYPGDGAVRKAVDRLLAQ